MSSDTPGSEGLALPLRAVSTVSAEGFNFGWCVVDANNRVLGYCMTERQAAQLVEPFAVSEKKPKREKCCGSRITSAHGIPCDDCPGLGAVDVMFTSGVAPFTGNAASMAAMYPAPSSAIGTSVPFIDEDGKETRIDLTRPPCDKSRLTPVGRYIDLYREHCGTAPTLNNQECEVIRRLAEECGWEAFGAGMTAPSAIGTRNLQMEELWAHVRTCAEGSDWKRDEGETLPQWAWRKLRRSDGKADKS